MNRTERFIYTEQMLRENSEARARAEASNRGHELRERAIKDAIALVHLKVQFAICQILGERQ